MAARCKVGILFLMILNCLVHTCNGVARERNAESTSAMKRDLYNRGEFRGHVSPDDSSEGDDFSLADKQQDSAELSGTKSTESEDSELSQLTEIRLSAFSSHAGVVDKAKEDVKKLTTVQLSNTGDVDEHLVGDKDITSVSLENMRSKAPYANKNRKQVTYDDRNSTKFHWNNGAKDPTAASGRSYGKSEIREESESISSEELNSAATVGNGKMDNRFNNDYSFLPTGKPVGKPRMVGHWEFLLDSPADRKLEIGTIKTEKQINPLSYKDKVYKKSVLVKDLKLRVPGSYNSNFDSSPNVQNQPVLVLRNFVLENKVIPKPMVEYSSFYASEALKRKDTLRSPKSGTSERPVSASRRRNPNEAYLIPYQDDVHVINEKLYEPKTPHVKDQEANEKARYFNRYSDAHHESGYQERQHLPRDGASASMEGKGRQSVELNYHPNIREGTSLTGRKTAVPTQNVQQKEVKATLSPIWDEERILQSSKAPPGTTNRAAVDTMNRAHVDTTNRAHVYTTNRAHVDTTNRAHVDTTNRAHVDTTNRAHVDTRKRAPLDTRNHALLESTNRAALDTTNRVPLDTRNRVPLDTRNRVPLDTRNRAPLDTRSRAYLDTRNHALMDITNGAPHMIRQEDSTNREDYGTYGRGMKQPVHQSYSSEEQQKKKNYAVHSSDEKQFKADEHRTFVKDRESSYSPKDRNTNKLPISIGTPARGTGTHANYHLGIKHLRADGRYTVQKEQKTKSSEASKPSDYVMLKGRKQAEGNQDVFKLDERQVKAALREVSASTQTPGTLEHSDSFVRARNLNNEDQQATQSESWNSRSSDHRGGLVKLGRSDELGIATTDATKEVSKTPTRSFQLSQTNKPGSGTKEEASKTNSSHRRTRTKLRRRIGQSVPDQEKDHLKAEEAVYHWGMEKHKDVEGYFQYVNNPEEDTYEYGYRMGSPEYMQERYHYTSGTQFKTKVNWEDDIGNFGDQYWEFNHGTPKVDSPRTTSPDSSRYVDYEE